MTYDRLRAKYDHARHVRRTHTPGSEAYIRLTRTIATYIDHMVRLERTSSNEVRR